MKRLHCIAALAVILTATPAGILAAPIGISVCTVISSPGSYIVDGNITAAGDCIQIQSDFVTLDLGGHRIMGNGTGAGISNNGAGGVVGVTVRNGTVTNFMRGVSFGYASVVVVERTHVIGNIFGIELWDGIVRDNVLVQNTEDGIRIDEHGLVTGNLVMSSSSGIRSRGAGTISGNIVAASGRGIVARASTVSGNTVYGGAAGLEGLSVTCPSLVLGNTSTSNAKNLAMVVFGPPCTVDHNAAP